MFGGWTVSYNSDDIPSNGTGDHEHYSYYRNRDKLKVYDKNGNEFIGCKKTAIFVRKIETHDRDFNMRVQRETSSK